MDGSPGRPRTGERWEADLLDDGSVEIERLVSQGESLDESTLDDLFARFGVLRCHPRSGGRCQ